MRRDHRKYLRKEGWIVVRKVGRVDEEVAKDDDTTVATARMTDNH